MSRGDFCIKIQPMSVKSIETQAKSHSAIFVLQHERASAPSQEPTFPNPHVVFATYQLHKMYPNTPIFLLGKSSKRNQATVSPIPTIKRLAHMAGVPEEKYMDIAKPTFNWQAAPANQVKEALPLHKHNQPELFTAPVLLTFERNRTSVQKAANKLNGAGNPPRVITVEEVIFHAAKEAFADSPYAPKALQNLAKEIKTIGNPTHYRKENARRMILRSRKAVRRGAGAWKKSLRIVERALRLPPDDRRGGLRRMRKIRTSAHKLKSKDDAQLQT